jgi:hypothetical protein
MRRFALPGGGLWGISMGSKLRGLALSALVVVIGSILSAVPVAAASTGSVQPKPATYTPSLATTNTDGSVEVVRQLTPCGATMYAVGRFTLIKQVYPTTTTLTRNNAFSFDATTGAVSTWNPDVNGQVNSVAVSSDCSTVYLGGSFTSVGGVAAKNLVAVSAATGQVISTFAHSAAGKVNNLVMTKYDAHLLVGGTFTSINGSARKYLASLHPSNGTDDGYANLSIAGNYVYTQQDGRQSAANQTQIYNMQLSPDGTKLLAEGVFTSVGSQARRQIFMADLGSSLSVDPWYSTEFNQNCYVTEPFYLQAASWAPNMSQVYVVTTGYKPATGLGFSTTDPRYGLCDAVAAFPATASALLTHSWINYTGCDSLFSTAADATTVYVGGHERWASNPNQCDNNKNGTAVTSSGMGGFDPSTGQVVTSSNPLVGKYQRSRGQGADDELITAQGLWIASDNGILNGSGSTTCGGVGGKSGICLLPY